MQLRHRPTRKRLCASAAAVLLVTGIAAQSAPSAQAKPARPSVLRAPVKPAFAQQGCSGNGPDIAGWNQRWASRGVTLCKGIDNAGNLAAYVTIVDQALGAKMRVVSTVASGSVRGVPDTQFTKRTASNWYSSMGSFVSSPSASQLFSTTNGAFFMDSSAAPTTALSLPEKTGNSSSSEGWALWNNGDPAWAMRKRVFALSNPGQTPQDSYIREYPKSYGYVDAQLPNIYEGVVGFYPIDTVPGSEVSAKRTFVGWNGSTKRVYLVSTWAKYTNPQVSSMLASFGATWTMQLDGGGSTAMYSGRTGDCLACGGRPVPEVLAVYMS